MRRSAFAAAAVLAAASAAPLCAQDASSDVKCFMASNVFAKAAPDDKGRQAAVLTRFYYLGRIEARLSAAQQKAAIAAQGKSFDMTTAAATMNTCVQRLDASSRSIQAIGEELSKSVPKPPVPAERAAGR